MEANPTKILINAYNDREMTESEKTGSFTLPINPEQYAQKFEINYDAKVAPGNQGVEEKFIASAPEELKLDFVFDGTDTVHGYVHLGKSVPQQIREFKEVVYDLSGEIHQPRYLKVMGLGITFHSVLKNLDITYTLFKTDGTPLRAKISATFLNFKEVKRRVAEEGKNSPNLTHFRQVKGGDGLPLMVYKIYKDPKYYLEVARANNLTNFRRLNTGEQIRFPPFKSGDA
jgi:nucleoid-associated protein YgaU